jgi:NitT/TauT family transport system permease protein
VIVPAALPLALAGLRLGIGRAVNGAVLGEMLISSVGIGGLMMYYGGAFRVDFLYALILLIVTLAIVLMSMVHAMETWAVRWMR